ncbi:MAG: hypothetical protein GC192_21305 [Bacteroidetes bacterium]|nr:hypothetical protein [Bacteroidota bacterium]
MNTFKVIETAVWLLLAIAPLQSGKAQSPTIGEIELQKADFRGQRPQGAIMAAVSASRQDVVIVFLQGCSDEMIAETEGNLKGLIRNGYTRLGLILSDSFPDEPMPIVAIFSIGLVYAEIHDAKVDAQTSSDVYKLVRDAYQEDILPKLKPETKSTNGGF